MDHGLKSGDNDFFRDRGHHMPKWVTYCDNEHVSLVVTRVRN
jgi:hypothetical protein